MVAGGQIPSFGGFRFESDYLVWVYSRCVFRLRNTCNSLRSYAERLRVLDSHQGFVKGVCWDPVGEFIATQSDDRSVIIWRTTDWGMEAEIKKPFEKSPGTFFRRLRCVAFRRIGSVHSLCYLIVGPLMVHISRPQTPRTTTATCSSLQSLQGTLGRRRSVLLDTRIL